MLTLRIRTQIGTWRLSNVAPSDTFADIRLRVEKEHSTQLNGALFSAAASTTNSNGRSLVYPDNATVREVT